MNWQQWVPLGVRVRARGAKIRIGLRSVCEAVTSPDSFPKSTQPSACLSPILEKDRRGRAVAGVLALERQALLRAGETEVPRYHLPHPALEDQQLDLLPFR